VHDGCMHGSVHDGCMHAGYVHGDYVPWFYSCA